MRPSLLCLTFILVCFPGCAGTSDPRSQDIAGLIERLQTGDDAARAEAAEALGNFGPAGQEAVPALALSLRDEYEAVRRAAAASLAAIGADKRVLDDLTTALKDTDPEVRQGAAQALATAGPAAQSAVSALTALLHDGDEEVRQAAADALSKIGRR
jgi:HEAT repeat protein